MTDELQILDCARIFPKLPALQLNPYDCQKGLTARKVPDHDAAFKEVLALDDILHTMAIRLAYGASPPFIISGFLRDVD
jgi:hypothetical protein